MSYTSPSMQNTNGLRIKFRSRTRERNLFQGSFHLQNNFLSVLMTLPPLSLSLILSPTAFHHLFSDPETHRSSPDKGKGKDYWVLFTSCQSHGHHFLSGSAGTTQVDPKKGRMRDTWLFFTKKTEVENGIKRKGYYGETLLETGYCKKECTKGKERVEGGQKKEIG